MQPNISLEDKYTNPYYINLFKSISGLMSLIVFATGCLVLAGWILDIKTLKSVVPGLVDMKANASIAFILLSISLWLQQEKRKNHFNISIARILAFIALLIGVLTLSEYLSGWDIGIDQLLFNDTQMVFTHYPGRMSPFTALCFILTGFSLLMLDSKTLNIHSPAQYLNMITILVPATILLGYIYPISLLYKGAANLTPMAVHTAFGFVLLCAGILSARPEYLPIRLFTNNGIGGKMARHLLLVIIFAPIAADALSIIGQSTGIYNEEVRNAIHVTLIIGILLTGILIYSRYLELADIKRIQAEERLKENRELLQAIIDNSTATIYIKDIEGRYVMVNKRVQDIFHIPIGKTDYDLFPKKLADQYNTHDKKVIVTGQPLQIEETAVQDDGIHTYISVKFPLTDSSGNPYAICGISTDITEFKKLEDEVLKARQLESLGTLAGGIAHDFNNLLTALLMNISLSKMHINPDDKTYGWLTRSEDICMKAKNLSSLLITFAKGGHVDKKTISISGILKTTADTLLKDTDFVYEVSIPDNLSLVPIDDDQIETAIKNIITNAMQATPAGGTIRISAENTAITKKDNLILNIGNYIKITIEDSGHGIPGENISRIFDPYFTTGKRYSEKGSGLGLTLAFSIIKRHDGIITVESKEGIGTKVYVYLPALTRPVGV